MQISRYLVVALVLATAACEDPFASVAWEDTPFEVTLFSGSRSEYAGQPSAFDLASTPPRSVAIENEAGAGAWDVLLIEVNGGLSLAPAGFFEGITSRAAVAEVLGTSFEDLERAPGDDAAYSLTPVRLRLDAVYVIKSRPTGCALASGPIYAKIQPLELDQARGVFRFNYVDNPNCGDRALVPEN